MEEILASRFVREFCRATSNMYRLGWDERNGGNISMILEAGEAERCLPAGRVLRRLPIGFDASALAGRVLFVTGTGKYFKNVAGDPERNLGVLRISDDGAAAELLWGFRDGGSFTSELPAHLMSHIARLGADPGHRVVIHTHPTHLVAMTYTHALDERAFTRTLWRMSTECIVVFPDGVGVLPWMLCGTRAIGAATADKMRACRLVVWAQHGVYGAGRTLDEAFGLIETAEKAAQIYSVIGARPIVNTIRDDQLRELAEAFGVVCRRDYLDD